MERNRKLLKKNQSKFVLKRGERILPKIFTPDMKKKTRKVSQRDRDLVSVSLDYNNEAQEHSQSFCNQYVAEKINSSFSTERGKNNVNISFTSFMQQSENLFKKRKVSRRPVKTPHLSFLKEFLSLNSRNKKGVGTTQTCKAVKSRPYKYRIVNPPECIQGSLTNKKISRREFPFHKSHADSVQTSHLTEVDHKNISFKGLFRYHKRI
ncbi:unnamed protein product [Moneuplotes crassus]|uniref:Uncharacterized protein n=1 Tax=Euplotes crassus TaxID=5936 RepID=A0AAD1U3X5_EUPCR|nr:unnamed protein product [Moneuplotes crassus]